MAKGGDQAAKQNVDAAFSEFKKAYAELLLILGPLGVVTPALNDGALGYTVDGPLVVPQPEALTL